MRRGDHQHARTGGLGGGDAGRGVLEHQAVARRARPVAPRPAGSSRARACLASTSSAAIISGGIGRPAAAMRRRASSRGADVTTAQRSAGSAARNAAHAGDRLRCLRRRPSPRARSPRPRPAASTPGRFSRATVSMARMPWIVGRKAATSTPWRSRPARPHALGGGDRAEDGAVHVEQEGGEGAARQVGSVQEASIRRGSGRHRRTRRSRPRVERRHVEQPRHRARKLGAPGALVVLCVRHHVVA